MTTTDSHQDIEALRKEIDALKAELAQLRKPGSDNPQRLTEELQEELRQTLENVRARSQAAFDKARTQGDKVIDDLEKRIQDRPLLSLLLMFLAGAVMARLLERR